MNRVYTIIGILALFGGAQVWVNKPNRIVEHLTACKSGWVNDASVVRKPYPAWNYIPTQERFTVFSDVTVRVLDPANKVMATLGGGQTAVFDCFYIDPKETI